METLHMVRKSANGVPEQVGDVPRKDRIYLEADGLPVTLGAEELAEVGQRKGGFALKEAPLRLVR